jgi:hypothetical protein
MSDRLTREAVSAMDALNAYARVPSAVISTAYLYTLKERLLRQLWGMMLLSYRRVSYDARCGICGESGWYRKPGLRSWGYDEAGERCRTCTGRGRVALHFVETTAPGLGDVPIVWHAPANHGNSQVGADLWNVLEWTTIGDCGTWTPRQPGRDLPIPMLAAHLLTVEAWLVPALFPMVAFLDLGNAPEASFCPDHGELFGETSRHEQGRLTWRARTCAACGWHGRPPLLDDPTVQRWGGATCSPSV